MNNKNGTAFRRPKSIGALFAFAAMISLSACSGGDDDNASTESDTPVAESAAPAAPAAETAPSTDAAATRAAASTPAPPAAEATPSTDGAATPATESAPASDTAPSTEGAAAPAADSAPAASGSAAAPEATGDGAIVEVAQLADWYFAVLVDETAIADPVELEPIGRSICPDTGVCQVGLWYDRENLPDALPVSGAQLGEEVFGFGRNDVGTEFALWNCNKFPQFEDQHKCLPRQIRG